MLTLLLLLQKDVGNTSTYAHTVVVTAERRWEYKQLCSHCCCCYCRKTLGIQAAMLTLLLLLLQKDVGNTTMYAHTVVVVTAERRWKYKHVCSHCCCYCRKTLGIQPCMLTLLLLLQKDFGNTTMYAHTVVITAERRWEYNHVCSHCCYYCRNTLGIQPCMLTLLLLLQKDVGNTTMYAHTVVVFTAERRWEYNHVCSHCCCCYCRMTLGIQPCMLTLLLLLQKDVGNTTMYAHTVVITAERRWEYNHVCSHCCYYCRKTLGIQPCMHTLLVQIISIYYMK